MKIVVPSCAKYSDCWLPLVKLFGIYWSERPYPLALATDKLDGPWHGDEVYSLDVDAGWCMNLAYALGRTKDTHIIMWLEDFFLTAQVDDEIIDVYHTMVAHTKAKCLRLYPCPGNESGDAVGPLNPKGDYLVSTQVAIWDRLFLIDLLRQVNGSAWDFEIKGTLLMRGQDGFFAVGRECTPWPVQYLCSGVNRGKWNPDALELFKKHKIKVDLSKRPVDVIGGIQD